MPAWLDIMSGVAATVVSAAILYAAHASRRFFRWLRDQADIVDALDRAGASLASAAHSLADTAARLERSATLIESAHRREW